MIHLDHDEASRCWIVTCANWEAQFAFKPSKEDIRRKMRVDTMAKMGEARAAIRARLRQGNPTMADMINEGFRACW